jgi:hypothetical protein
MPKRMRPSEVAVPELWNGCAVSAIGFEAARAESVKPPAWRKLRRGTRLIKASP